MARSKLSNTGQLSGPSRSHRPQTAAKEFKLEARGNQTSNPTLAKPHDAERNAAGQ